MNIGQTMFDYFHTNILTHKKNFGFWSRFLGQLCRCVRLALKREQELSGQRCTDLYKLTMICVSGGILFPPVPVGCSDGKQRKRMLIGTATCSPHYQWARSGEKPRKCMLIETANVNPPILTGQHWWETLLGHPTLPPLPVGPTK